VFGTRLKAWWVRGSILEGHQRGTRMEVFVEMRLVVQIVGVKRRLGCAGCGEGDGWGLSPVASGEADDNLSISNTFTFSKFSQSRIGSSVVSSYIHFKDSAVMSYRFIREPHRSLARFSLVCLLLP
jgi:hypothetical protein